MKIKLTRDHTMFSVELFVLGRSPFVRADRTDPSRRNENFPSKNAPVRSVKS